MRACLSAVFMTTTERPTFSRSCAVTNCMITHCCVVAPAGVSQRRSQSPCLDLTSPCADGLGGNEKQKSEQQDEAMHDMPPEAVGRFAT